jgi:hypothetical protein
VNNFVYTCVFCTLLDAVHLIFNIFSCPPCTLPLVYKSLFGLYLSVVQANGIEDHSFVKEMDYQEVLNSQEIFGDELAMFAKKELQKEVGRLASGVTYP